MLDIGWMEMAIICVIALLILGPKELPRAIRTVTQVVGRARGLANEFRSGIDEIVQESELKDLQKEINDNLDGKSILGEFDDDPTGPTYDFVDDDWHSPSPPRPLDDEDRVKPRRKRSAPARLKTPRGAQRRQSRRKVR
jgi:sec-independent protein translocase protein TatB